MATKKKIKLDLNGFESKEEAASLGYTAVIIERISDGRILNLNSDLQTYSFVDKNDEKQTYSYEQLMIDSRSKGKFRVLGWGRNMNSQSYLKIFKKIS